MIALPDVPMELLIPSLGGYSKNSPPLFYIDDDSCACFVTGTPYGSVVMPVFSIYVCDASGSYTYYRTADNAGAGSTGGDQIIVPLGSGWFFVLDITHNRVYIFRLSNAKLNNASPIVLNPSATAPSNRCYNQLFQFFYDSVQKILACGSSNIGLYGGQMYSTNYKILGDGSLEEISNGDVGYYQVGPPTLNPWIQFSGPQIVATQAMTTGVQATIAGYPQISEFSVNTIKVGPGVATADCATPNGSFVGTRRSVAYPITYSGPFFDTNLPGIAGYLGAGGRLNIFSGYLSFYAQLTGLADPNNVRGACITRKHIFLSSPQTAGVFSFNAIWRGDASGVPAPAAEVFRTSHATVNMARPISITGRYKA